MLEYNIQMNAIQDSEDTKLLIKRATRQAIHRFKKDLKNRMKKNTTMNKKQIKKKANKIMKNIIKNKGVKIELQY